MRLARSFTLRDLNPLLAERYVMLGGVSGLVGARVWFMFENWTYTRHDIVGAIFSSAGFTFYGGFIVASIVLILAARRDGIPLSTLCDTIGPCLALGYAIGRVGCQLSGDGDYGVATQSWWGMSYSTGVVPTPPGELVYPAPLFESVLALGVLAILTWVERSPQRLAQPFSRFGLYLILISVERFLVEFVRPNPSVWGGFSEAQMIAIALVIVGVVLLGRSQWRSDISSAAA